MLTIEWLEKEQKCVIDNRKEIVATDVVKVKG